MTDAPRVPESDRFGGCEGRPAAAMHTAALAPRAHMVSVSRVDPTCFVLEPNHTHFEGRGILPINNAPYRFFSSPPERVGDEAIILLEDDTAVIVMLLRSSDPGNSATYLVARAADGST